MVLCNNCGFCTRCGTKFKVIKVSDAPLTSAPRYEREADKRSRVIYEVDTLDQGKIVFYLSLDNISTHSEISEERCISEFDKLSQYLEQEFGVKTKFRAEGEKPPEKLIQKGEMDFPEEGIALEKA